MAPSSSIKWTPENDNRFFQIILRHIPDLKIDWKTVSADFGEGLQPGTAQKHFYNLKSSFEKGENVAGTNSAPVAGGKRKKVEDSEGDEWKGDAPKKRKAPVKKAGKKAVAAEVEAKAETAQESEDPEDNLA